MFSFAVCLAPGQLLAVSCPFPSNTCEGSSWKDHYGSSSLVLEPLENLGSSEGGVGADRSEVVWVEDDNIHRVADHKN